MKDEEQKQTPWAKAVARIDRQPLSFFAATARAEYLEKELRQCAEEHAAELQAEVGRYRELWHRTQEVSTKNLLRVADERDCLAARGATAKLFWAADDAADAATSERKAKT